jgi:hypothetical protein
VKDEDDCENASEKAASISRCSAHLSAWSSFVLKRTYVEARWLCRRRSARKAFRRTTISCGSASKVCSLKMLIMQRLECRTDKQKVGACTILPLYRKENTAYETPNPSCPNFRACAVISALDVCFFLFSSMGKAINALNMQYINSLFMLLRL